MEADDVKEVEKELDLTELTEKEAAAVAGGTGDSSSPGTCDQQGPHP